MTGQLRRYCYIFTILTLLVAPYSSFAVTKSATVTVNVNVLPACTAGSTNAGVTTFGTLNFGSQYQLTQSVSVTGQANSGAISVQCVAGVPFTILMGAGNSGTVAQRYMQGTVATRHVNYNLYTSASYATIWDNVVGVSATATGLQQWLPVYGLIPVQTTPAADSYSDTIQVTVTW